MTREYTVFYRDFRAWILIDGSRTGPFVSVGAAASAAVALAKLDFKSGQLSKVTVEDETDRIVYDSHRPIDQKLI